ncbi:MAG: ABC transporter substrate-binding protein [Clostridia bacterium]|nr:ABC transporter substrate-binding protein [Clostridia bacterium]
MKNLKKVLAVLVALTLVVTCFAACGGNEEPKNEAKEIVIGVSGPLTGGAAQYGNAVVNAAQLAVDEINAAGGVNGVNLKLVTADDEADPGDKAVSAYNSLKDQGMQIFLGTVTSGSCLAVIDKTSADQMFQLTPSASADDVIANDNTFQICFTDSNQGTRSAQYISENKIAKKIAVIYDSSDAYSTGIYNSFMEGAKEYNLEVVTAQSFQKDNKDFSAQINACKAAGAELVFLPIYYTEASLILQQAAAIDYAPKFFGCDGLDGLLAIKGFDTKLAEGVMLLTPFAADKDDDATQKFVAAYKAAYNDEIPNQFAADAYDGIYIIAKLIEQEGITADMSAADICAKLKVAICADGFSYMGITGAGSALTWDATGAVSKDPMAVIIKDGAYVAL